MKFKPSLAHLCIISCILSTVAVIKGASFGDSLIIIAVQLPFLLKTYLESRIIVNKSPEIEKLEQEMRKEQLIVNLDNLRHQHIKEQLRRDAESANNGQGKTYIF